MKLATLRTPTGTIAVRVTEDGVGIELPGVPDVGALLSHPDYARLSMPALRRTISIAPTGHPSCPIPGRSSASV